MKKDTTSGKQLNFKKRILILNYEFPPLGGGASPVSYEIAKGYVNFGHSVDVVTMGFKELPSFEKKEGVNIYRVNCLRTKKEICHPWEQLSYLISAKKFLKKHLKTHSYDINHTHFIIPTGVLALWLNKKYKLDYILTAHGSDVPNYNSDRFKILHKFTKPLLRKICHGSKRLIVPSKYLSRLIEKEIGSYPSVIIPNGISSSKFIPKRKEKIILSTGRLISRKGFQYLIKAVSKENLGYELHIVGDGPMIKKLKKMAKKSKTKIIFHGWLNNKSEDYKKLLKSAAIYVLVSEKENSSIALLEAMSSGCAIITSNNFGCVEMIYDAGIAIKPRNEKLLKESIKKLIQNPQKIRTLGKKSRKRFLQKFNLNILLKEYEKCII